MAASSGVQAVAMPLIAEFQFTREIEDRLLAPIEIEWLAIEKVVAGMIQALVAGLVVIPTAWLVMGSGVNAQLRSIPLAVGRAGAAGRAAGRRGRPDARLQRRASRRSG